MSEYKHGVYATSGGGAREQTKALRQAFVYVGASPILQTNGWRERISKPIVVTSFQDAVEKFGFSWDFITYPLCEAMYENFVLYNNGPVVMICTVKDVKSTVATTIDAETKDGMFAIEYKKQGNTVIMDPDRVHMETIVVKDGEGNVIPHKATYNADLTRIEVREAEQNTFPESVKCRFTNYQFDGKFELNYVDNIGTDDKAGKRNGMYAVRDVYASTGMIPSYLIVGQYDSQNTGASSQETTTHKAMRDVSLGVNEHWNMMFFSETPMYGTTETLPLNLIANAKKRCHVDAENEITFGMKALIGEKNLHVRLNFLAAAVIHDAMLKNDGLPVSISNLSIPISYAGINLDAVKKLQYTDEDVNEYLNKHGICGACYGAGNWLLWGNHTADYDEDTADEVNVNCANRMMLYYIANDFQQRRWTECDKPISKAALRTIVAQEQARLDALVKAGALCYGEVHTEDGEDLKSDMMEGNFRFVLNVTVTPVAKSMTAKINWTDAGLSIYNDEEK